MFIKRGAKGKSVRELQKSLRLLGYYTQKIDGDFGPATLEAVYLFQLTHRLNCDGIVGPLTYEALGIVQSENRIELNPFLPTSRDELYEHYGDPLVSGFWSAYGGFCPTPPELNQIFKYKFKGTNGFWCHKKMILKFQQVYFRIVTEGCKDSLFTFDGCYNLRNIRGRNKLSSHSWGISVDHNAFENPLGGKSKMDEHIVEIFEDEGFTWGGDWQRIDAQHLQYGSGF